MKDRHRATVYMFDVCTRRGKNRVWNVYADSVEEAEENAKFLCNFLGAVFLGNITESRTCAL